MNKYEKLIEYIVNEDQAKAKALFHEIVVEKSREIYESIIEDELGGDEVEGMVDDVTADEEGMSDSEEEFGGEEGGDEFGGEEGEEGGLEDRVMDLEDALDELKAEFDALMSDEENEPEHNDGIDDPEFGGNEGGDEFGGAEEEVEGMYMESEEDAEEADDEEEEDVAESRKSSAERIREYVEKVSDGHGAEKKGGAEGSVVGKDQSSKPTVNSKGTVAGKNDMGGTSANIVRGGAEQAADGTSPKGKVGGFVKKGGDLIGNVENRVNSKTKGYTNREGAKKGEDGGVNKTSIEAGGK